MATGAGHSLKVLAPLAGFSWRDESPGGDESMVWYTKALGGGSDAAAYRDRILAYNEDDVLATRTVRDWLDTVVPGFPTLSQWNTICRAEVEARHTRRSTDPDQDCRDQSD